jgi:hypothetical protein
MEHHVSRPTKQQIGARPRHRLRSDVVVRDGQRPTGRRGPDGAADRSVVVPFGPSSPGRSARYARQRMSATARETARVASSRQWARRGSFDGRRVVAAAKRDVRTIRLAAQPTADVAVAVELGLVPMQRLASASARSASRTPLHDLLGLALSSTPEPNFPRLAAGTVQVSSKRGNAVSSAVWGGGGGQWSS